MPSEDKVSAERKKYRMDSVTQEERLHEVLDSLACSEELWDPAWLSTRQWQTTRAHWLEDRWGRKAEADRSHPWAVWDEVVKQVNRTATMAQSDGWGTLTIQAFATARDYFYVAGFDAGRDAETGNIATWESLWEEWESAVAWSITEWRWLSAAMGITAILSDDWGFSAFMGALRGLAEWIYGEGYQDGLALGSIHTGSIRACQEAN